MSRGGRVGKHKLCTFGAGGNGPTSVGWQSALKITHLLGSIFVLAHTRKKPECAAFNYTNSLIGDIAMHGHIHVVKSCP